MASRTLEVADVAKHNLDVLLHRRGIEPSPMSGRSVAHEHLYIGAKFDETLDQVAADESPLLPLPRPYGPPKVRCSNHPRCEIEFCFSILLDPAYINPVFTNRKADDVAAGVEHSGH